MDTKEYKIKWGGRDLSIFTGGFAGFTSGAVRVQYGETTVFATATVSTNVRDGIDYFPLMVDYREHYYAAGKIKGSRWIKREGRPTDDAVLTGRLIDRSIRPLFNKKTRNDVQVVCNVMSIDGENSPDLVAFLGAVASTMISSIPFGGPVVGARVGLLVRRICIEPNERTTRRICS